MPLSRIDKDCLGTNPVLESNTSTQQTSIASCSMLKFLRALTVQIFPKSTKEKKQSTLMYTKGDNCPLCLSEV
jgi:hypothetical protein